MHESLKELKFRPDTTTNFRVICPCVSEKLLYNVVKTIISAFIFDRIFFIFAGNEDNYKVLEEFEICPYLTMDCRVTCP